MKTTKRIMLLLLALTMVLTACQKQEEADVKTDIDLSSYPIETDVTLSYFRGLPTNISTLVDNYAETNIAQEFEKRTGVKIEYVHPGAGAMRETINLLVASDELPDIMEGAWHYDYSGGPVKAIKDEVLIDIAPYKEYAPGLFGMLEADPELDKAAKTDDGQYYGFPQILTSERLRITAGPTVRGDWMQELGLDAPETIADWEEMLTAFKEKKGAKAPLSFNYALSEYFFNLLGTTKDAYRDGDKVMYGAVQPEFLNALTIANDWFNKGLLDKNIVSVDDKIYASQLLNGSTGATFLSGGSGIGPYLASGQERDPKFDLLAVKYPSFNEGEESSWAPISLPISGAGVASVTTKCKYPALAVKVLDYFYTEEGKILGNFGVEGVSFEMVDGKPTYTDLIMKNPDGWSVAQALGMHAKASSSTSFPVDEGYINQYYALPQQQKALDAWMRCIKTTEPHKLPTITPTTEESAEYANIMNEVQKYRDQMIIKFITGIEPLENFDKYVETLNKYGLERAMEIQTAALKRYNER